MESNDEEGEEFGFSRNYFLAKELRASSKKSTRTLSDIDIVDEQELRDAAVYLKPKHEKEILALISSYKSLYSQWVFMLRCGFGLLMYGFGSKKALIENFVSTALSEYSVGVVSSYLQYVNIKQYGTRRWFSHNLTGAGFMFLHAPYVVESTFFSLILAEGRSAQSAKKTMIVLQSLTPNAQSVFEVLAKHQLSHRDEEGIPISDLKATCLELFLVSSQVTLNSPLTEFKDLDLSNTRRHADGQDCLSIPLRIKSP